MIVDYAHSVSSVECILERAGPSKSVETKLTAFRYL